MIVINKLCHAKGTLCREQTFEKMSSRPEKRPIHKSG